MAAAALLRYVARKLARPPPPHPLVRGLRGGARSGMADRLAVGMAAAAPGLRSGEGLPSLAKIARAPPQGYHRRLHERGLHSSTSPNPRASGSTPPPTSDQDLIENLRFRLAFSTVLTGVAGSVAMYLYFWALPEAKAEAYSRGLHKLESLLSGDGRTRVDESEVDEVLKSIPVIKELVDDIKDIQSSSKAIGASIKEHRAAAAKLTEKIESYLSEEECKQLTAALKSAFPKDNERSS